MSLDERDRKILGDVATGVDNAPAEVQRAIRAALAELDRLRDELNRPAEVTPADRSRAWQDRFVMGADGQWALREGEV